MRLGLTIFASDWIGLCVLVRGCARAQVPGRGATLTFSRGALRYCRAVPEVQTRLAAGVRLLEFGVGTGRNGKREAGMSGCVSGDAQCPR